MDQLVCASCAATDALNTPRWRCPCGGLLSIQFAAAFDRQRIASRPPTMWRYREALPLAGSAQIISLGEGFTPLLEVPLRKRPVWIKQDHLAPTGSYKDRGAALLISQARALGITEVVEDSSGNAGAAIAAYCARADIACHIYCPSHTSPEKTAQIAAYGATLHLVPGSREETAHAALAAAQDSYYASHVWNPFFFQGTKTWAFEVCEQLGWRAPDTVVLPVGNGTLFLGAYLGFADLRCAGIIGRLPKLIGVQVEQCAPLARAWHGGHAGQVPIPTGETVAEGIAIAAPMRGPEILRAARETGGTFISVTEAEIAAALHEMCRLGFYIEPTSAASIAGAYRYLETAGPEEEIVTAFTGHGLKAAGKVASLLVTGSVPA